MVPAALDRTIQLIRESTRRRLAPRYVVLLDTLPVPGPDHIGIISDRAGDEGLPLVVNSWTDGYRTSEMNLLGTVPVLYRFRAPCHLKRLAAADAGLAGVFKRNRRRRAQGHAAGGARHVRALGRDLGRDAAL